MSVILLIDVAPEARLMTWNVCPY